MPLEKRLTRILIFLLVLRIASAPMATQPDAPTPSTNHHLVIRKCLWPAQRPLRMISASNLGAGLRSPGYGREANPVPGYPACRPETTPDGRLSRLLYRPDRAAIRLIDGPRC